MKNIKTLKFKTTFDPGGYGVFHIKVDDNIETPVAIVPLGIGIDPIIAKKHAKVKAERIVKCLNHCQGMKL